MKYIICEKLAALWGKLTANRLPARLLALLLALVLLQGDFMLPAYSAGESSGETAEQSTATNDSIVPSVPEQAEVDLPVDEDTLIITLDGTETSVLELFAYEKVEVRAEGLEQQADYQWQIQHPETGAWINIYDATEQCISVSAALVKNMLDEDGTAALRCRAHTEEYAYLTDGIHVTLLEEPETASVQLFSLDDKAVPMAEGDDATPEFVTITINYERYDYERVSIDDSTYTYELSDIPTPAFNPYIATIQYNTTFHAAVTVPTIVGYNAYLEDGEDPITMVTLNYDEGVTSNQSITVKYLPADVNYTVRYYFQNIYDDNYMEDTSKMQSLKGPTGSAPADSVVKQEFTGFTSMFYQPDTIAADGSTVFEVYYERNYYLMDFDCDGGYGTDPVYVRYGTYISIPTPKKSGWTFRYWYLTGTEDDAGNKTTYNDTDADALPTTMPAYNSHYKAVWGRDATTFTVIYWVQNANDDGYSYVDSIEDVAATTGDVINLDNITQFEYTDSGVETSVPKALPASSNLTEYSELSEEKTESAYDKDENGSLVDYDGTNGVLIEGDGSSIFNIYFNRKSYYIKFYYARSSGSGTPTSYQLADNTGGSSADGGTFASSSWEIGNVTTLNLTLPTADRNDRYTYGTILNADYTYHYFTLKAKYDEDISDLWPAAPLTADGYTFVSWSTQYGTDYNSNNNNKNIKGPYSKMDKAIIKSGGSYDTSIGAYEAQFMVAYWNSTNNIRDWTYNIYVKALVGADLTGKTTATYNGNTYFFWKAIAPVRSYHENEANGQTALALEGYTCDGRDTEGTDFTESTPYSAKLNFYYSRTENTLSFENYGSTHQKYTVSYGQDLASYISSAGIPTYPDTLEPGAYTFVGWFTGPLGTGEQVTVNSARSMADADLILFAYWKPVVHNVYFYSLYTDVGTTNYWTPVDGYGNAVSVTYPIVVQHGDLLGTTYSYVPTREGYRFVGWFYMDENGKKRFAPDSMEIKQELHLFAEWQSDIDTTYTVSYVLKNDATIDGTKYSAGTPIASVTEGHSTAGKTKTFNAKGDTELYPAFRIGIFPETGSHSILMQEDSAQNVYSFEYVYDSAVLYKVRYVDYETKQVLEESDPKFTNHAVVTEKFLPISGYIPMPGYYYQRKSLTADYEATEPIEANIITFYYMKDAEHGAYSVEYYLQNADGSYTQATSIQNTADLKDSNGKANVINSGSLMGGDEFEILIFDGYTYKEAQVINYNKDGTEKTPVTTTKIPVQGTLDTYGLTIKLYYDRISYAYQIQFVASDASSTILGYGKIDDSTVYSTAPEVKAPFGTVISYTAPASLTVNGTVYEYYIQNTSDAQRTGSMTIRSATADSNPNVLKFYYTPKQYTVHYKAVCTDPSLTDFGVVSPSSQIVTTVDQLQATATPYSGYSFVGWYTDETCETAVDSAWLSNTVLTPKQLTETTYYALFKPILTEMTISKTVTTTDSGGNPVTDTSCNDTFLFLIEGQSNNNDHINLIISIQGTKTVTVKNLPIGKYKITELTDWSWQYSCTSDSSVTIDAKTDSTQNAVSFTNAHADPDWLGGESAVADNNFN